MKKKNPSKVTEFFARESATDTAFAILTEPDLTTLDIIDRAATAILQIRAQARTAYRNVGLEPQADDDGFEARALRIRKEVTLARDALRQEDAHQAVECAVRAAMWLVELQMLDAIPDGIEVIRESIRLSAQEES